MNEKPKQKQISIRIDPQDAKELKKFCVENDVTMTQAVKIGLELFKLKMQK